MFYSIAACLASYYLGFYTYMYVNLIPRSIKDNDYEPEKIKYKQL